MVQIQARGKKGSIFPRDFVFLSRSVIMSGIPVKVSVQTTISNGGEQEVYELVTFGQFFQKGNSTYLRYEELMDEGKINTSVKFSGDDAVILRSGAINMRLAFKLNHMMRGHYESPYGTMETLTETKALNHQLNSDGEGKIHFLYDFTIHGDPAGTYNMEIRYKEDMSANEHSSGSPK
jgi:uncharacterized beta-barrel protein YwiB (DUF1934 family)